MQHRMALRRDSADRQIRRECRAEQAEHAWVQLNSLAALRLGGGAVKEIPAELAIYPEGSTPALTIYPNRGHWSNIPGPSGIGPVERARGFAEGRRSRVRQSGRSDLELTLHTYVAYGVFGCRDQTCACGEASPSTSGRRTRSSGLRTGAWSSTSPPQSRSTSRPARW